MSEVEEVRLNIGAGQTHIPGFVNIDISPKADVSIDIGKEKLPFDDDAVDLVFSYHTLEHVPDYLFALSEVHRVLKHGGRFLVGLPYVTLAEYHLINPYHLHSFSEHSFDFFDTGKLKGSAAEENPILFSKVFHRFHYMGFFHLVPPPFRSWCRRHLFNVVRKIDYGLVAVKKPGDSLPPPSRRAMMRRFDECLDSRITYETGSKEQDPGPMLRLLKRTYLWWYGYGW